jgi:hypothetical protein
VILLALCAAVVIGYLLGRWRPMNRASDWANWQSYCHPKGLRRAAVWTLLSAENIAGLATHPVQGWHAWKHRNDPPPRRSPAVAVHRNTTERTPK